MTKRTGRPSTRPPGPLADLRPDEIAALASACDVSERTAHDWRFRRPKVGKSDLIAETLHRLDPERWPEPVARELREMEAGR